MILRQLELGERQPFHESVRRSGQTIQNLWGKY